MALRSFLLKNLSLNYISFIANGLRQKPTKFMNILRTKTQYEALFRFKRGKIPILSKSGHKWLILFCNPVYLLAFSLFQSKENQPTIESASLEQLLANVDKLHTSGSEAEAYSQLCNALATGSAVYQCAEVFWRAARGARAMANATHDESARKALTYEAFEFAKQGLALEPQNSACHKWMGILLELTGRFEGTKKRIENSYLVRDHFQRAVEAKPDDAVVLHCLGAWCFEVADLPWYQRKLAAAFFATPPSSSYDEALKYLLKAEEVDPNLYSSNLLYIGKAYLRKGDRTNARTYLQRTVNYKGDTVDDKQSRDEAAQLLKSI
ncbi:hypothetical protein BOX15_Mlig000495g1 [Macrostomum lignano]|uniref:Regulator of microtubule dynamics protein 1 n=1 Tax=Macrostomum lignano TaxID=282301 RepID=A0A267GX72_9PLAT|nr:hypothetical protein BOX15_Mlig000495g1 [Macrostomum lignano]